MLEKLELDSNPNELFLDSKSGYLYGIKKCIDRGDHVNAKNPNGSTALEFAVCYNKALAAKYLIKHGAKCGLLCLMYAVQNGNHELAKLILDSGVNPNGDSDNIPLMSAVESGHINIVELLVEYIADVNIKDKNEITPLILCADKNFIGIAGCLVANGADINAKDKDGHTALMHAASKDNLDMVRLFVENGADHTAENSQNKSALDFAIENDALLIRQYFDDLF